MQPSRKAFESRKLHSCPSTTLNCSSERISDRKKGSDELIFPLFSADSFVIARSMKTGFPQRKRLTGELLLYNQLTNFTRKHNNRFPKFDTSLHF